MGQKTLFKGKIYTEPVSRAATEGGVSNTGSPASFGNICILDTGLGATYGGGQGILDGSANVRELDDFLNEFNSSIAFKDFVKGGVLWDLADYFYNPSTSGLGASKVFWIKAAATVAAQKSATFTGTFDIVINTKRDEGINANGVLLSTDLSRGYAWKISAGTSDPSKFVIKLFQGQYRGVDAEGILFDGIAEVDAAKAPRLVAQSIEFTTVEEFNTWADGDFDFQTLFGLDATSATTGTVVTADLTLLSGYQLFSGGTETYSGTALDSVLANIKELDCSIFLSLENDTSAAGANNLKVLGHIVNDAEFKKRVVIGGGNDKAGFATSKTAAGTLNSEFADLCHSGLFVPSLNNAAILAKKSSVYMAALVAGRMSGLEPQTPLTYKDLRITKLQHVLSDESDRVDAIDSGVLHIRTVPQLGFVINQGINTKQLNDFLLNNDGTSPEISIERIKAQLNREIQEDSRVLFVGKNLFTVNEPTLVSFTKGKLNSKMAVQGVSDGLIVDFGNVKAVRQGTVFFVTYDFQANSPINKIFSTGTIIDPSLA